MCNSNVKQLTTYYSTNSRVVAVYAIAIMLSSGVAVLTIVFTIYIIAMALLYTLL